MMRQTGNQQDKSMKLLPSCRDSSRQSSKKSGPAAVPQQHLTTQEWRCASVASRSANFNTLGKIDFSQLKVCQYVNTVGRRRRLRLRMTRLKIRVIRVQVRVRLIFPS